MPWPAGQRAAADKCAGGGSTSIQRIRDAQRIGLRRSRAHGSAAGRAAGPGGPCSPSGRSSGPGYYPARQHSGSGAERPEHGGRHGCRSSFSPYSGFPPG